VRSPLFDESMTVLEVGPETRREPGPPPAEGPWHRIAELFNEDKRRNSTRDDHVPRGR
jgi:hypothetical protein